MEILMNRFEFLRHTLALPRRLTRSPPLETGELASASSLSPWSRPPAWSKRGVNITCYCCTLIVVLLINQQSINISQFGAGVRPDKHMASRAAARPLAPAPPTDPHGHSPIPGSNEPSPRPAHGEPRMHGWDPLRGPGEPTPR